MAGRSVATTVYVTDPETGEVTRYLAGETPTGAHAAVIRNAKAWEGAAGDSAGFDPDEHTAAEVVAYAEQHPEDLDRLLEAERAGKDRTTVIAALERLGEP